MTKPDSSFLESDAINRAGAVNDWIESHGHGFQAAVYAQISSLIDHAKFQITKHEFPVAVGAESTHIDFILLDYRGEGPLVHIPVECKFVEPNYRDWIFVRTSKRLAPASSMIVEYIEIGAGGIAQTAGADVRSLHEAVEYGIDRKIGHDDKKTQPYFDGKKSSLKKGIDQAMVSTNGLVQHIAAHADQYTKKGTQCWRTFVYPLLITSAKLYIANIDLAESELGTGRLPTKVTSDNLKPAEWVYYQCPVSPTRRHNARRFRCRTELDDVLLTEFMRTVIILNVDHLKSFLETPQFRGFGSKNLSTGDHIA